MSGLNQPFFFDRIIAALDASCHDANVLTTAVNIGARVGAAVSALFIEDENLLRLFASPAARHVTISRVAHDPPSTAQVEADLRALATQAEAVLSAAAIHRGVAWSFRVVRGRPAEQLGVATMSQDLVIVGRSHGLAGMPLRLGSPIEDAVRQLERSILHVAGPSLLSRPAALVRAGSPLVERTLAAALRLAGPHVHDLDVWLTGERADADRTRAELTARLAGRNLSIRSRYLPEIGVENLGRAIAERGVDLLVIASDTLLPGDGDVVRLVEQRGTPVMTVH